MRSMIKCLALAALCLLPVSAHAGQSVDACHAKCAHFLKLDSKSQSKSQYSFCRAGCKTSADNKAIDLRKVPPSVTAGFAKALDGDKGSAAAANPKLEAQRKLCTQGSGMFKSGGVWRYGVCRYPDGTSWNAF